MDSAWLKVRTVLGEDTFLLQAFEGEEAMSGLFRFGLEVASRNPSVDPRKIIGTGVSWSVGVEDQAGVRHFHGIVQGFLVGPPAEDDMRFYRLDVVPWLWFLTQTATCKIFQDKSAKDIIEAVLTKYKDRRDVHYDLSQIKGAAAKREYAVQFNETDFAFISRIAEEEGIFYFFRHEEGKHTLVMGDRTPAYYTLPHAAMQHRPGQAVAGGIHGWTERFRFHPDRWVQRDYNFKTPRTDLTARTDTVEKAAGLPTHEIFDYPGRHDDKGRGESLARIRMEEIEAGSLIVDGAGDCRHFSPGGTFTVEHQEETAGGPASSSSSSASSSSAGGGGPSYVLTRVSHRASAPLRRAGTGNADYRTAFACIPRATLFRPPRDTARPVMRGPQVARVTGRKGEEIDCDEYGRVHVQFPWDRDGKEDEKSSCWIRVAQSWAGRRWGAQFIPRIGDEVLVDFLDGDPDRPVIVGSLYNADNMPPLALPDNKTQSGIRTRSTPDGGTRDSNELRFEDRTGSEDVYFHAQKDFHRVVENKDDLKIKDARTVEIGKGLTETIKQGGRSVTIQMGDDGLTVSQGNQTTKVSLGSSSCEAMQSIELKVGGNSIKIDQTGITISGLMIKIEGQVMGEVKAPILTLSGDGMATVKGGIVMIN